MTKSEALQKAQIEYLSNDDISSPSVRSPFYWSGWAMYGSNDAISQGNNILTYTYLGIGALILLSLFILIRRKINSK